MLNLRLFVLFVPWAFSNLSRNRKRSILSAAGIAAAVTCITMMQGFAQFSFEGLAERFAKSGNGHLQIGAQAFFSSPTPEKFRLSLEVMDPLRTQLTQRPELQTAIESISYQRKFSGLVGTAQGSEIFQGLGMEPLSFFKMATTYKLGNLLRASPSAPIDLGEFEVILGKTLAERLGVHPGDSVSLLVSTDSARTNAMDFTVAGTLETGSAQLDALYLLAPLRPVLKLMDSKKVDVLMIGLKDTRTTASVENQMNQVLHRPEFQTTPFGVRTWDQLADYYQSVRMLYGKLLGTVKLILGLISVLAISNTLFLVIYERQGEIGMLRAIGVQTREVVLLFCLEAFFLGAFGALFGLALAAALSWGIDLLGGIPMPPPPGSTEGYRLRFLLSWSTSFSTVAFFSLLATATAWFAARRTSQLHIPTALAYGLSFLMISLASPLATASDSPERILSQWETLRGTQGLGELLTEIRFDNLDEGGRVLESVTYKIAANSESVLAISSSDAPGSRMSILSFNHGMWMQKEGMRKPIRVSPAQRLLGQASNGDVVSVRWSADYAATSFDKTILSLIPKEGASNATYGRIELDWDAVKKTAPRARFFALSGKLLKTASFQYEKGQRLKSAEIQDAILPIKTRVTFGPISKGTFGKNFFSPEVIPSSSNSLIHLKLGQVGASRAP